MNYWFWGDRDDRTRGAPNGPPGGTWPLALCSFGLAVWPKPLAATHKCIEKPWLYPPTRAVGYIHLSSKLWPWCTTDAGLVCWAATQWMGECEGLQKGSPSLQTPPPKADMLVPRPTIIPLSPRPSIHHSETLSLSLSIQSLCHQSILFSTVTFFLTGFLFPGRERCACLPLSLPQSSSQRNMSTNQNLFLHVHNTKIYHCTFQSTSCPFAFRSTCVWTVTRCS